MEEVKIYGLCLERLRYQITNARKRINGQDRFLLECYNTGEIDDIIDILELYDVAEKTQEHLGRKLDELAYTASLLVRESVTFDYTDDGHLGLYWIIPGRSVTESLQDTLLAERELEVMQ
jgi:hypothetical protein